MGPIQGVLFDFDGVLADTPVPNCRAWQEAFAPHGIEVNPEVFLSMEGSGKKEVLDRLSAGRLTDEQLEAVFKEKQRIYFSKGRVQLYPGVVEALKGLREKGLKLAVVSGSTRDRIDDALGEEIIGLFEAVVTAESVTKTKPDPEPFQVGMSALGLGPEVCLVIENAPLGIESARAAGARCLAVATTLKAERLSAADEVFEDHAGLFSRIDGLTG